MMRKIFIKDWIIEASIGIYANERKAKQRLRLNLTFYLPAAAPIRSIADTVDYDKHKKAITALIQSQHFDLQEILAEAIATQCLTDPAMVKIDVQLEKIDIYQDCICGVLLSKEKA